jgi:hypothetical protein
MKTAEEILNTLSSQSFFEWYCEDGAFDAYIRGIENAPTKEEILEQIRIKFNCEE